MEIDLEKVDCGKVAERLRDYRISNRLSQHELAQRCSLKIGTISRIELGNSFKTTNQYWAIANAERMSISWLLFGDGKWNDKCDEYAPPTIIRKKGAGIRLNEDRLLAESGQYEGDCFEFVLAVESFKQKNNKPFPSLTEIYDLIISLGYRRVADPVIKPYKILNSSKTAQQHTVTQPEVVPSPKEDRKPAKTKISPLRRLKKAVKRRVKRPRI